MRVAVDKGKRTDISNRTDLCRVDCCSRIQRKALRRRFFEYLLRWNECLWVVFLASWGWGAASRTSSASGFNYAKTNPLAKLYLGDRVCSDGLCTYVFY